MADTKAWHGGDRVGGRRRTLGEESGVGMQTRFYQNLILFTGSITDQPGMRTTVTMKSLRLSTTVLFLNSWPIAK